MAWLIILGTLAALGLLSVLWAATGWLLLGEDGGLIVCLCCPGHHADGAIRRYHWLKELGLVKGPLLVLFSNYSPQEQEIMEKKYPGIEFCSLEALPARLEAERKHLE